jgi:hypothetical protein
VPADISTGAKLGTAANRSVSLFRNKVLDMVAETYVTKVTHLI